MSVAYVNVVDGLTSFFWWREKVDKAREALLVVKTKLEKLPRLVEGVKELHSYVARDRVEDCLGWIDEGLS